MGLDGAHGHDGLEDVVVQVPPGSVEGRYRESANISFDATKLIF